MERTNLESVVASQKDQLLRYEKRLKDVVAAYKGLLKEKEALETSLSAITASSKPISRPDSTPDTTDAAANETTQANSVVSKGNSHDDESHLQTQIMALMNSLATLSSEKSRMEASFQGDKKQLRALLAQKDQNIAELQTKIKSNEERARSEVDDVKAKWIIERQDREKETNNQMLMIRELQKLYGDERHLKENIEMQLNNFKTQFANNETENSRRELLTQLKEAKAQIKQMHSKNKRTLGEESDDLADSAAAVLKEMLYQEMQQLKEQHAVAIKNEQTRVLRAEEQSRRQAALHEDRVANLESRLAELSSSVGTYDRLRQQDQDSIQALKKQLHELELCSSDTPVGCRNEDSGEQRLRRKCSIPQHDVASIVEEIVRLKKLLANENARSANGMDVAGAEHVECQEELNRVQQKCEAGKLEVVQLLDQIQVQKSHISTLQEKVKVLNRNIDDQELELKQQTEKLRQATKSERTKWRDTLAEMENDFRCKVNDLEQQLQKQRQRSLQLLDEKEQEIKTLQTSFEVFHGSAMPSLHTLQSIETNVAAASSDAESTDEAQPKLDKLALKSKKLSVGENCHMLHYANEIARKDIEIANLRKAKYAAETSLRKAIQDKVNAQEDLCDQIATLEEQVDRLERCKTREGANLEYLKNVIISFIVTKDADGKRHMMNAISAVLQFTPAEIQAINAAAFHKK